MSKRLIDLIIPHYCCSCGEIGGLLCAYCKYDITCDKYEQCIACLGLGSRGEQLCRRCKLPYSRAWCIGARSEALCRLIDAYKFERARAAGTVLATLADEILPDLPHDLIVVPVPTIAPHIRRRGYGHVERLARELARLRKLSYQEVLSRETDTVQHGSSRREREIQASKTFASRRLAGGRYLLVDDVYTTGATTRHAANKLRRAGADDVWVFVASRQPLEK